MSVELLSRANQNNKDKNIHSKFLYEEVLRTFKNSNFEKSEDLTSITNPDFLDFSLAAISNLIGPSSSLSKSSGKNNKPIQSNNVFEYDYPLIKDEKDSKKGNTSKLPLKQIKNHYPAYKKERCARAVKNLKTLNNEFSEIVSSNKLNTNEERERFVEIVLGIKIENQVKTILGPNSNPEAIRKAQQTYLTYVKQLNKDSIKNISSNLNEFFSTYTGLFTFTTILSAVDKQIPSNSSSKKVENSLPTIDHEYLNYIGNQMDKGTYRPSIGRASKIVIAKIASPTKLIPNSFNLIEGSDVIGFAHIANGHYAPNEIKENGMVIESVGIDSPKNMPGEKTLFPLGMNSKDIVDIMIESLSLDDSNMNIQYFKDTSTGKIDSVTIKSTFPKEISGVKSVTMHAALNTSTNAFHIITFYPLTGSKVRKVHVDKLKIKGARTFNVSK